MQLDDALDRVEAVAGLADDLDVGLVLEHEPHAAPEQRVRVDEQDSDRRRRSEPRPRPRRSARRLDEAELRRRGGGRAPRRVRTRRCVNRKKSWPSSSIWSAASSASIGFTLNCLVFTIDARLVVGLVAGVVVELDAGARRTLAAAPHAPRARAPFRRPTRRSCSRRIWCSTLSSARSSAIAYSVAAAVPFTRCWRTCTRISHVCESSARRVGWCS